MNPNPRSPQNREVHPRRKTGNIPGKCRRAPRILVHLHRIGGIGTGNADTADKTETPNSYGLAVWNFLPGRVSSGRSLRRWPRCVPGRQQPLARTRQAAAESDSADGAPEQRKRCREIRTAGARKGGFVSIPDCFWTSTISS